VCVTAGSVGTRLGTLGVEAALFVATESIFNNYFSRLASDKILESTF
jgi:hypothetical protein